MKIDLHQQITDRLVAAIEAGTKPWVCDWTGAPLDMPQRANGAEYRGINVVLLWASAVAGGYASNRWMTFKQAQELGGCVRKGERSTQIVFFKKLEVDADNDGGDAGEGDAPRFIPMMRGYNVFNVDQIDGLPDRFAPPPVALVAGKERDAAAEAALRSCGASIAEDGGNRAYYSRTRDSVHLPAFDRFTSTGGFLATLAHELVHWTGAPHRLDRAKGKKFGDRDYAFEELVAEIGAAFVCARLGIAGEHIDNHASYIGGWLEALKGDKRAIFRAASLAQSAADLVLAQAGEGAALTHAARDLPAPATAAQFALAL